MYTVQVEEISDTEVEDEDQAGTGSAVSTAGEGPCTARTASVDAPPDPANSSSDRDELVDDISGTYIGGIYGNRLRSTHCGESRISNYADQQLNLTT